MPTHDPPDKVLIDAVLDGLKTGVAFLIDNEIENSDIERLVKKTADLASVALAQQLGEEAGRKLFVKSENAWILRTAFGGWVFFYPIEELTPDMPWDNLGHPQAVYWPDADGNYANVPWSTWSMTRQTGTVWRPTARTSSQPKSIWERLRER